MTRQEKENEINTISNRALMVVSELKAMQLPKENFSACYLAIMAKLANDVTEIVSKPTFSEGGIVYPSKNSVEINIATVSPSDQQKIQDILKAL